MLLSELAVNDSAAEDARDSPSSNGMEFSFVSRVLFFTKVTYFQCTWAYLPKTYPDTVYVLPVSKCARA